MTVAFLRRSKAALAVKRRGVDGEQVPLVELLLLGEGVEMVLPGECEQSECPTQGEAVALLQLPTLVIAKRK